MTFMLDRMGQGRAVGGGVGILIALTFFMGFILLLIASPCFSGSVTLRPISNACELVGMWVQTPSGGQRFQYIDETDGESADSVLKNGLIDAVYIWHNASFDSMTGNKVDSIRYYWVARNTFEYGDVSSIAIGRGYQPEGFCMDCGTQTEFYLQPANATYSIKLGNTDPCTGLAWTTTKLNGVTYGWKIKVSYLCEPPDCIPSDSIRADQSWIVVWFSPSIPSFNPRRRRVIVSENTKFEEICPVMLLYRDESYLDRIF